MTTVQAPQRALPSLRAIFALLHTGIFLLPLVAFVSLRIYDRQLIRQTEAELLIQGVVVAESAQRALAAKVGVAVPVPPPDPESFGRSPAGDLAAQPILDSVDEPEVPTRASGPDDALAATVGADITPLLQAVSHQTLAGLRLVDSRGVVIGSSGGQIGLSLAGRPEVEGPLSGKPVSLVRKRHDKIADTPLSGVSRTSALRVFVGLPVRLQGRTVGALILSRTPLSVAQAFYQDRYFVIPLALVLLAAVLLASLATSALVLRPMRRLAARAQALADGGAAPPAGTLVTREAAELSTAFELMSDALRERSETVRALAANISHEFKTPLTSLRGTIELLRDQIQLMDDAQRRRFLEILQGDAARLGQLVDRLLDLARADVARPGDALADPLAVARAVAERSRDGQRALELVLPPQSPKVRMAPDLLDAVLGNLVQNAWDHGAKRARLSVEPETAQSVRLLVSDDGPGISPNNRPRVFEPFFTTARAKGGTGLGLTIVQTLVKTHRGQVQLIDPPSENQPDGLRGATFAVTLPAAEARRASRDELRAVR